MINPSLRSFNIVRFSGYRSQSKASYLAYRRERGAPDTEGSYKRTMSPTSRLEDWPPPRDHDDPVLLRVTPHHPLQHHHHHHHNNHHHQQQPELSKSHSVDALHHRLEERSAQQQQQQQQQQQSGSSSTLNRKVPPRPPPKPKKKSTNGPLYEDEGEDGTEVWSMYVGRRRWGREVVAVVSTRDAWPKPQ